MRALASFLMVLGIVGAAQAAPGDLDTSFSGDGKIVETGLTPSHVAAVAIQPDGKIVAVGSAGHRFRRAPISTGTAPRTPASAATDSSSRPSAPPVGRRRRPRSPSRATAGSWSPGRWGARTIAGSAWSATCQRRAGHGVRRQRPRHDGLRRRRAAAAGMAIQTDGKIVLVGATGADARDRAAQRRRHAGHDASGSPSRPGSPPCISAVRRRSQGGRDPARWPLRRGRHDRRGGRRVFAWARLTPGGLRSWRFR